MNFFGDAKKTNNLEYYKRCAFMLISEVGDSGISPSPQKKEKKRYAGSGFEPMIVKS